MVKAALIAAAIMLAAGTGTQASAYIDGTDAAQVYEEGITVAGGYGINYGYSPESFGSGPEGAESIKSDREVDKSLMPTLSCSIPFITVREVTIQ